MQSCDKDIKTDCRQIEIRSITLPRLNATTLYYVSFLLNNISGVQACMFSLAISFSLSQQPLLCPPLLLLLLLLLPNALMEACVQAKIV